MKKFFSLVLALVMALSLTTVAWGAVQNPCTTDPCTHEAAIGTAHYDTLKEAFDAAVDGDTVKLLKDVTVAETLQLKATGTIVVDGTKDATTNYKITSTVSDAAILLGSGLFTAADVDTHKYTLKNIDFDSCTAMKAVEIYAATASIDSCTFTSCTPSAAAQMGLIHSALGKVTVSNCVFDENDGNLLIYFNTNTGAYVVKNCTFTDNEMSNIGLVYFKGAATFSATGNTFTGNTVAPTASGSNAAIIYADKVTATGNTFSGNTVTSNHERAGVVVADEGTVSDNVFSGNTVSTTATGTTYVATVVSKGDPGSDFDMSGNYWDGTAPDYANAKGNDVTATTYYTTATGGVLGGAMTVGGAYSYDMVTTDAAQTKTVGVTVATFKAKAPKDTNKDGLLDQDGNVKYVVFSNLPGKTFVQVNTVGEADYTVYQTGTKTLFGYFNEVASPFYKGNGVAFYDFGEKCGQYDDEPTVGAKYYLFQGVLYKAVTTSGTNLMVGNVLTPVEALADKFVDHVPAFTYDKTYKVVGVKCAECGTDAVIYANYAAVPKADKAKAVQVNDDDYYVWLAGPGAVVDTETKVESAETFDAGIAMYVGMSVMAAAGSAVVLKKKD